MDKIESGERAVLCSLFHAFPETFAWIGGSVLHLLHASPQASYDLDLCPLQGEPPLQDLGSVVRSALDEINPILSSRFKLESRGSSHRLTITESGQPAFLVDVSRIAGRPLETVAVVLQSLLGPEAVIVPTDSSLLSLKIEALLFRRFLKAADVFDVWFLIDRGVRLSKHQRASLSELVRLRELEPGEVRERLLRLTPERFLAELKRRLSPEAFHDWKPTRAKSAVASVRRLIEREIQWR